VKVPINESAVEGSGADVTVAEKESAGPGLKMGGSGEIAGTIAVDGTS
jgi:hypothetical protein